MVRFQPKDPLAAEWQKVYEVLVGARVGELVRDDALAEVLGRALGELSGSGPVYRAIESLERDHHRSATRLRGVGWVIVEGFDHYRGGVVPRRRRSRRLQERALESSRAVSRSRLSPAERELVDQAEKGHADLLTLQRAEEVQRNRVERALQRPRDGATA